VKAAFPTESFATLAELEPRSFWFRGRNDLIAWALGTYFPDAASFLEVGCGTGFVLLGLRRRFPGLRLVGGEPEEAGLAVASERLPDVELRTLDARDLPFDSEFDVVGAFDVLEHIDDDEVALEQLRKAAKPGGGVLLTVPQHPWLWSSVDEFGGHRRRYRREELIRKAEAAGLEVLRTTSAVTFLLPLVALSRLRDRRTPPEEYDVRREFSAPPKVDALLERVLWLERRLIARGVSFPAGSSLLLVARRRLPA
jgi:SAM-dependent methyltransferase